MCILLMHIDFFADDNRLALMEYWHFVCSFALLLR